MVVTGATGTTGREVVRALLAAGAVVRALATDPARARAALAPKGGQRLETARLDIADASTFADAFAGARAMFLLRPPAVSEARILNFATDAAIAAGVRHVVFLSVQGAGSNPVVPHHAIERHLMDAGRRVPGLRWSLVRAAFFMQNLSVQHADDIRDRDEIFVPAGDGRTAFVDARDLGDAAARLLLQREGPSAAYECTGREALTYHEVATILTRVLGRPIRYARPGAVRFWREMRRRGHPAAYVGVMTALYTTARLGLAGHLSDELAQLLGREPTRFEEFARESVGAWRNGSE